MIELYTWTTPNGRKVPILLEELGLLYTVHPVDIGKGEQLRPDFLAISPNNKIPAIVDTGAQGGPLSIFESGAILTYLADKVGKFLEPSGAARWKTLEWVFWQVGGLGPMLGQLGYFVMRAEEKTPAAIARFTEEADRLLMVMEKRLTAAAYLAGEDYTIADIAAYPWTKAAADMPGGPLDATWKKAPAVKAWLQKVGERPAVQRGMAVPKV